MYTQLFSAVPDQWPSPTMKGSVGLGTITGQIGVVKKTKRDVMPGPTQEAMVVTNSEEQTSDDVLPIERTEQEEQQQQQAKAVPNSAGRTSATLAAAAVLTLVSMLMA